MAGARSGNPMQLARLSEMEIAYRMNFEALRFQPMRVSDTTHSRCLKWPALSKTKMFRAVHGPIGLVGSGMSAWNRSVLGGMQDFPCLPLIYILDITCPDLPTKTCVVLRCARCKVLVTGILVSQSPRDESSRPSRSAASELPAATETLQAAA